MTPGPRVSVIIATYTRAALLDECLHHLGRQAFGPDDEVIVVDNGSTDHTAAVIERHQRGFPVSLRLLYESQPGKSHALAQALAIAQSEILAFTDDDVNVEAGWLQAIREAMAGPEVALLGGRVAPRWQATVPGWIRRAPDRHARLGAPLGLLDYGPTVAALGPRTALGANLAVRRSVFGEVGGFAPHLGKLRGTLLSGEDHELCRRVQQAGFHAIYLPAAVVHHWVPADRARVSYFLKWFYWSGITNAMLDDVAHRTGGRAIHGLPLHLVRRAASAAAGLLVTLVTGRWTSALDRAIDVAFVAGYAAERWGITSAAAAGAPRATGETT